MYAVVGSSVLSPAGETRFFGLDVGVRQGCALSPLLFAIFINGLAKEVKAKNVGVNVERVNDEGKSVPASILLYADDIVLLAESKKKLQQLMDVVTENAHKWRYEVNQSKSKVVVFGSAGASAQAKLRALAEPEKQWKLGGGLVEEVSHYKYLGCLFERSHTDKWKLTKEKMVQAARRKMRVAWGMGVRGGVCSAKVAVLIWNALVRPALETAMEVVGAGSWPEAEKVQLEMGKKILRSGKHTSSTAVRGELGWWTLEARRDLLRLGFWRRLVKMDDSRVAKHMYVIGRKEKKGWAKHTKVVLERLGLGEKWQTEDVGTSKVAWRNLCIERLQTREELRWKTEMEGSPKLRTYRIFKKTLQMEPYLAQEELVLKDKRKRWEVARIRTGSNKLRVEMGRQVRPMIKLEDRKCLVCNEDVVEDEAHFLLECKAYVGLRQVLQTDVERVKGGKVELSCANKEMALVSLLGEQSTHNQAEMCNLVGTFVVEALKVRKAGLAAG
jgi:hypothetical protein